MSKREKADDDDDTGGLERVPTEDYTFDHSSEDPSSIQDTPVDTDAIFRNDVDTVRFHSNITDFEVEDYGSCHHLIFRYHCEEGFWADTVIKLPLRYPMEAPEVSIGKVHECVMLVDKLHAIRAANAEACTCVDSLSGVLLSVLRAIEDALCSIVEPVHKTLWSQAQVVTCMPAKFPTRPTEMAKVIPGGGLPSGMSKSYSVTKLAEEAFRYARDDVQSRTDYSVVSGDMIASPAVLKRFALTWDSMVNSRDPSLPFYYPQFVFHGTWQRDNIEKIGKLGLFAPGEEINGEPLPVANGQAYGRGAYVSRTFEVSRGYSHSTGDGDLIVIVGLCLLGHGRLYTNCLDRPKCTCTECHYDPRYDSTIARNGDIIVLHTGRQMLPLLKLTCTRRKGGDAYTFIPRAPVMPAFVKPPASKRKQQEAVLSISELESAIIAFPLPGVEDVHVLELNSALLGRMRYHDPAYTHQSYIYVVDWCHPESMDVCLATLKEIKQNLDDGESEHAYVFCGKSVVEVPFGETAKFQFTKENVTRVCTPGTTSKMVKGAMHSVGMMTQHRYDHQNKTTKEMHNTVADHAISQATSTMEEMAKRKPRGERDAEIEEITSSSEVGTLEELVRAGLIKDIQDGLQQANTFGVDTKYRYNLVLITAGKEGYERPEIDAAIQKMSLLLERGNVDVKVKVFSVGSQAVPDACCLMKSLTRCGGWERQPYYSIRRVTNVTKVVDQFLEEVRADVNKGHVLLCAPDNMSTNEGFCTSLVEFPKTQCSVPMSNNSSVTILWKGHLPQQLTSWSKSNRQIPIYHQNRYPLRKCLEVSTDSGWKEAIAAVPSYTSKTTETLLSSLREEIDCEGKNINGFTFRWKGHGQSTFYVNDMLCRIKEKPGREIQFQRMIRLLLLLCMNLKQHVVLDIDDTNVKKAAQTMTCIIDTMRTENISQDLIAAATPSERIQLVRMYRGMLNDLDVVRNEITDVINFRTETLALDRRMSWVIRSTQMKFGAKALRRVMGKDGTISTEKEIMDSMRKEIGELKKEVAQMSDSSLSMWRSRHTKLDGVGSALAMITEARTPSELLYCNAMPGVMVRVRRLESAVVNPWNIFVEYISTDVGDTAFAMISVAAQIPRKDSRGEACTDVIVLHDTKQLAVYRQFLRSTLYKSYLAVVFTRNPLLQLPAQHSALLMAGLVQSVLQLQEQARSLAKDDVDQWTNGASLALRFVMTLRNSIDFTKEGYWRDVVLSVLKPNPATQMTEAPENDVTSLCKVLAPMCCGPKDHYALYETPEGNQQLRDVAMGLLSEATSRCCRVRIRTHPEHSAGKDEEISRLLITRALKVEESTCVIPTPDDCPDHDPKTLKHSDLYDLESGLKASGAFFLKNWTNCSPQAVVACLGVAEFVVTNRVADHPDPCGAELSNALAQKFRSGEISMRSFLPKYAPSVDPKKLQVALYIQGLSHHDSHTRRQALDPLTEPEKVLQHEAQKIREHTYNEWLHAKKVRLAANSRHARSQLRELKRIEEQKVFLACHQGNPRTFTPEEVAKLNADRPPADQIEIDDIGLPLHHCSFPCCPQYLHNFRTVKDVAAKTRRGLFGHLRYFRTPVRHSLPGMHQWVVKEVRKRPMGAPKDLVESVFNTIAHHSMSEEEKGFIKESILALVLEYQARFNKS